MDDKNMTEDKPLYAINYIELDGEESNVKLFSTLENARAWVKSIWPDAVDECEDETEDTRFANHTDICATYFVKDPDYGADVVLYVYELYPDDYLDNDEGNRTKKGTEQNEQDKK